jgi:hypothetical protein
MKEISLLETQGFLSFKTLNNYKNFFFIYDIETTKLITILNVLKDNYSFQDYTPNLFERIDIYSSDLDKTINDNEFNYLIKDLKLPSKCVLDFKIKVIKT